ncbi:hypothetical protein BLNAU_10314 [Blattamonas nauphoetae]|uniref:Uncharacterized protein n=1 Tax=Blattamonas nauphoetae TaxID=2049346 RepID=A0ABQ9XT56_9EUKA|nr:hypothetical protein BLNAU_10314 [Blattamonas nauphoetae]
MNRLQIPSRTVGSSEMSNSNLAQQISSLSNQNSSAASRNIESIDASISQADQAFSTQDVRTMIQQIEPAVIDTLKNTTQMIGSAHVETHKLLEYQTNMINYTIASLNSAQTMINCQQSLLADELSRHVTGTTHYDLTFGPIKRDGDGNIPIGTQNILDRDIKENPPFSIYSFNPQDATTILNHLSVAQVRL